MFGDSAGIDFNNLSNPVVLSSGVNSSASSASISDAKGNLLFYTAGVDSGEGGIVYTKLNTFMANGSINAVYNMEQGLAILPFLKDTSKYYIFSIGYDTSGFTRLYYNVVDMKMNGGLGAVTQKNILLYNGNELTAIMKAVKHGNGRDWWLLAHDYNSNRFVEFLITPAGITGPYFQSIGSTYTDAVGQSDFSLDGKRFACALWTAIIDVYDFDRCTGLLSNFIDLGEHNFIPDYTYLGCAFSPGEKYLYVSNSATKKRLYQYDLTATNIKASKTLIWSLPDSTNCEMGELLLGPDKKIYQAIESGGGCWNSPLYKNGCYDQYNSNLSVNNSPDSAGLACNYTPFSFSLVPGRAYYGLPNMPNYNLGVMFNGTCDSLSGVNDLGIQSLKFDVFPNPVSESVTIELLENGKYKLQLVNMLGEIVSSRQLTADRTISVNVSDLPGGIYFIELLEEKTGAIGRKKIIVQ